MSTLGSVGEFPFIAAIRRIVGDAPGRGVILGIGDDAACLRLRRDVVVTVDSVVEGVHFETDWLTGRELGRRALRVAVSDLSASGADPRHALLALAMPSTFPLAYALGFVRGLVREGESVGVALVGGNVSAAPVFSATLTAIGETGPRLLRRDQARVGDAIYVTGELGGAAAGVELLSHGHSRGPLQDAYRLPPERVRVGRALARLPGIGAVIDVSDGLVQDLTHVCRASEVSAVLDVAAVPMPSALGAIGDAAARQRFALTGGEDYELLFTARATPATSKRLRSSLARAGCRVREIGRIVRRSRVAVSDSVDGLALEGGYAHFGDKR